MPTPRPLPLTSQRRRIGRFLAVLAVLLILLVPAGFTYETVARRSALSRQRAPGEFVDVGGYQLHILCMGEENAEMPVVILESGVGGWSIHWAKVQQQIASFARVCAYDRAGMGWSETGPLPRDGEQVVNELHTLLQNAGVPAPYVLVGASRGGQYARLYAAAFPDEVSGMVLVDAEPEEMRTRSVLAQQLMAQNQAVFSTMGLLARLGVFRFLFALGGTESGVPTLPCLPSATPHLPAEQHPAYLAVEGQPPCFRTVVAEDAASDGREAQVRAAGSLGDMPLVVLTHGLPTAPSGAANAEAADEYEAVWQELQAEMAALSSNSVLVVADDSGHDIMFDQPELVVESVRRVVTGNVAE